MMLSTSIKPISYTKGTKITTTYELTLINRETDLITIIEIKRKEAMQIIEKLKLTYDEEYKRYM